MPNKPSLWGRIAGGITVLFGVALISFGGRTWIIAGNNPTARPVGLDQLAGAAQANERWIRVEGRILQDSVVEAGHTSLSPKSRYFLLADPSEKWGVIVMQDPGSDRPDGNGEVAVTGLTSLPMVELVPQSVWEEVPTTMTVPRLVLRSDKQPWSKLIAGVIAFIGLATVCGGIKNASSSNAG